MRAYSLFAVPANLTPDQRQSRRRLLARMAIAWLLMMQVMMFAFPGYVRPLERGEHMAALDDAIVLMNWVALVLTVPAILYCAWPVWRSAAVGLLAGRVSIDLPVALSLVAAFVPSAHATWTAHGEVYFDSVTMFLAFLLTARYLELCARQSGGQGSQHPWLDHFRVGATVQADRLAFWFVLIQLALAFVVAGFWYMRAPDQALPVFVALLVMSCPCAMAMSVPTAVAAVQASLAARPPENDDEVMRRVMAASRVARQNLYGSIAWHLLMVPLAAVGWVAPWLAALAMLVSSLAVAANAWRLFHHQVRAGAPAWSGAAA